MTTLPIRDVSLFAKVAGRGTPLVLMHGGPGLDHTTLLPLEPLADQFTLVFYDHRCNGRSDGAAVESMTWDNLTADADALRQVLGFDRWAVLGHSFGGMVALEYALRYPQRLSRLLLMDTCGDAWWVQHNAAELVAKRGYSAAAVQAVGRFFNGQLTPGEFFPMVMKFLPAYSYHSSLLGLARDAIAGRHMKARPETSIFAHRQLLTGWTVMGRLGQLTVPTLVLAGRADFLFPPEHQAILADRIPNSRLELFERSGHNPQMEQTAEVIAAIRRFLSAADSGHGEPAGEWLPEEVVA